MRHSESEDHSSVFKKMHRREVAKATGGCPLCPPHRGENYRLKGRKVRSDQYKSKRKGK